MKDFRYMINSYLMDHKKQKKYLAFVLALSILVTFAVPLSLMQPAESLTIDRSHLAEQLTMADGTLDLTTAQQWNATISYGAAEIFHAEKTKDMDAAVITTNNASTTEDSVDLDVYIEYAFDPDIRSYLTNDDGSYKAGPHLMWNLGNPDLTAVFPNGQEYGELYDSRYSSNTPSGTYQIIDGIAYITLTEDYVLNYVCREGGDGSLEGTLEFEGVLNRASDESGDQTLEIAGQEVTVDFPDKRPGVSKTASLNESSGTIEWTLTVANTFNLDLSSYTMSDLMLVNAKNVTISPSTAAAFNDDKTISFTTDSKNHQYIIIKYTTDITESQLEGSDRTNTVTLTDSDGFQTSAEATANFYKNPFTLTKSGTPDYESDHTVYNDQIDWTITLTNEYGVSLDGYIIRDEMLATAENITVSPSGTLAEENGEWVLSGVGNAKSVTIKYRAPVVRTGTQTGTVTVDNSVEVYYPLPFEENETPVAENDASVDYKSESDMYSLNKTGSYDKDSHKITWMITVYSTNNRSLIGYVLTDDAFSAEGLDITINPSTVEYTLSGNDLTITSDYSGWLQLTYTTDADVSSAGEKTAVNTVSDNKEHEIKDAEVSYDVRNTLSKSLNSSSYESVATSGTVTKTLSWTANIIRDGLFAGTVYSDTMSVDQTAASHSMTDAQLNAIVLTAKVTEYGQTTTLVRGTDADYTKNDDGTYTFTNDTVDYIVIPNDSKTGFEIVFSPKMDTAGYNYVTISYATTATVNSGAEYGEYMFSNAAGFAGTAGPNPGYTLNKTDPNVFNTMNANVQKTWNDSSYTADRPANAYFKLQYQTNLDSEWRTVRGSGENYLFYGDSSYDGAADYLITLNDANEWKLQLTGLPKETAKENADGTQGTMTYYTYRILEVDENGNLLVNNTLETANGFYYASYSCWNEYLSCTNKFYQNTQVTPVKQWEKEGSGTDIEYITVQLQYSTDQTNWYPVKTDADGNYVFDANGTTEGANIANQELAASDNWTAAAWSDLPSAYVVNGSVVTYSYRIQEISVNYNGADIDTNGKSQFVVDDGYYTISYSNNNQTVINTFYQTSNYTVTGQKVWANDDTEQYIENRPEQIIVQLQQKQADGTWQKYGDNQYLNADNGWKIDFENLPNQVVASDGTVTKYSYKLLEIGYVKNGTEYLFASQNITGFATTEEGYYKITGSGYEINNAGTLTITNTFVPTAVTEVTPLKRWVGEIFEGTDYSTTERPTDVKFTLQCNIAGTGWVNCKLVDGKLVTEEDGSAITDPITVTLDSANESKETQKVWENGQEVEKTVAVIWTGTEISGLPQTVIRMNADGSCTIQSCSYRFVESGYTKDGTYVELDPNASSFKTGEGKYLISYEGNTVVNTFDKSVGVIKTLVDRNGNELGQRIEDSYLREEKDNLAEDETDGLKRLKTITIDGEEYYIFNWTVDFEGTTSVNLNDVIEPLVDILPDGFSLVVDEAIQDANAGGKGTVEGLLEAGGGYFANPYYLYEETGFSNPIKRVAIKCPNSDIYGTPKYECTGCSDCWNYIFTSESSEYYFYHPEFTTSTYPENQNVVGFSKPVITQAMPYTLCYSTKIKVSDYEAQIADGSFDFANSIKLHEQGTGVDTGIGTSTPVKIYSKYGAPLITKSCSETKLPGEFVFSLDINSEGKNLSTGSTIDITDLFETTQYFDQHSTEEYKGSDLVDVLMSNVKLYTIDANGNKKILPVNQYTLTFASGTALSNDTTLTEEQREGAALIKLTIPDETHIVVEYTYSLIANEKTPSVINKCMSTTRVNGRYVTMTSGLPIPAGDKISFKNEASLKTESASAEDEASKEQYEFFKSSGTTATDVLPSIVKVRTGDYTINDLKAEFLLAKYENGQWFYAKSIDEDSREITWLESGADGTRITDGAMVLSVEEAYPVPLEKNVLYKLVEISVPSGYVGSNLNLDDDAFKSLITAYLNNGTTIYNGKDYAVFLNNYDSTNYFVYNSTVGTLPDGVDAANVMQIQPGSQIEIPNHELIDIGVSKTWVNPVSSTADSAITVELYWSETKTSTGMPEDAKLADAADLGILDESFSAVRTITVGDQSNDKVWTDLPNGRDGSQIYYYIKETAYTIGGVTYTLDEDNVYRSENGTAGSYLPTYVGNAASADTVIAVNNSYQLMLKKQWMDSANQTMKTTPVSKILVNIYGFDENGLEIGFDGNTTTEPLLSDVELTAANYWTLDITSMLPDDADLSIFKGFRAEESATSSLDTYVISCVFNLNGQTGEIIVTNKNTVPTEASVTVNKSWSDGDEMHANDAIQVTLFQATAKLPDETWVTILTSQYGAGSAPIMQPVDKNDTQQYQDYVLNAENDWTCTWTGLPMQNSSQKQYYYYVLETGGTVTDKTKYTAVYDITEQTLYRTEIDIENTRKAIVVQKQWLDEYGDTIPAEQLKETEIALDVYKTQLIIPEGGVAITTLGDSITEGYATGYAGGYAPYLQTLLEKSGFTVNTMGKHGHSQHSIMNMPDGVDYTTGESRAGIYEKLSQDLANETPDIACLMIGTNDIISNYQNNIDGRLETLINEVYTYMAEDGVLFVSTIPKFRFVNSDNSTTSSYTWFTAYSERQTMTASEFEDFINNTVIKNYNDKIEALVAELAKDGRNICFVDVYSVLNKDTEIVDDGCHPNAAGDQTIAGVWEAAIIEYFTPSVLAGTITLTAENNWISAFDITDNDTSAKYYIEESSVPDGWQVTYKNNDGQFIGSSTPMTAVNQRVIKETSLKVQKTWRNDENHKDSRKALSLVLFRSTDKENWHEVDETEYTVTRSGENTDIWTFEYTGLDAEDIAGNIYYYKVEEKEITGYQVTYGNDLVEAKPDGDAGTLYITNTMGITLNLKKQWRDDTGKLIDPPADKKIKVNIYRLAIDSKDSIDTSQELIFHAADCVVSVDEEVAVDANKSITAMKITEEGKESVTITASGSYDGEYAVYTLEDGILKVKGKSYGAAAVEVTDDKGTTQTITVNVTALKIQLDNADKPYELEAEAEGTLVAYYNSELVLEAEVVFEIDSCTVDSTKISLEGNKLIVSDIGSVTVKTTYLGITTKQEIEIVPPSTFVITKQDGETFVEVAENEIIEITEDSSIDLSVYKQYGNFKWSFTSDDGATAEIAPDEGYQVTVTGGTVGTGTIVAMRDDDVICSAKVKIVEKPITGTIIDSKNSSRSYPYEYNSSTGVITIQMTGSGNWENYYISNIRNDEVLKNLVPVKYVLTKTGGYYANIFGPGNAWGSFTFSGNIGTVDVSSNTTSFADYGDIGIYGDLSSSFTLQIYVQVTESASTLTTTSLLSASPLAGSTGTALAAVQYGELVQTVELSTSNGWETVIENLPVYDPNGKVYLYWVEEEFDEAASYETSYLYVDGDIDSRYWINALNPSEEGFEITIDNTKKPDTGVTLPSTGGQGTRWYCIAGMLMMLAGIAGTIGLKRRQSSQR